MPANIVHSSPRIPSSSSCHASGRNSRHSGNTQKASRFSSHLNGVKNSTTKFEPASLDDTWSGRMVRVCQNYFSSGDQPPSHRERDLARAAREEVKLQEVLCEGKALMSSETESLRPARDEQTPSLGWKGGVFKRLLLGAGILTGAGIMGGVGYKYYAAKSNTGGQKNNTVPPETMQPPAHLVKTDAGTLQDSFSNHLPPYDNAHLPRPERQHWKKPLPPDSKKEVNQQREKLLNQILSKNNLRPTQNSGELANTRESSLKVTKENLHTILSSAKNVLTQELIKANDHSINWKPEASSHRLSTDTKNLSFLIDKNAGLTELKNTILLVDTIEWLWGNDRVKITNAESINKATEGNSVLYGKSVTPSRLAAGEKGDIILTDKFYSQCTVNSAATLLEESLRLLLNTDDYFRIPRDTACENTRPLDDRVCDYSNHGVKENIATQLDKIDQNLEGGFNPAMILNKEMVIKDFIETRNFDQSGSEQDKIKLFSDFYRNNIGFYRWVNQQNIPSIADFLISLASSNFKEVENKTPITPLNHLREHPDKKPQGIVFPRDIDFKNESEIPGYGLAPFHSHCPVLKDGKMTLSGGYGYISNLPKSEFVSLTLKNLTGDLKIHSPEWLDIQYIDNDGGRPHNVTLKVETSVNGNILLSTNAGKLDPDATVPQFTGYSVKRLAE